MLWMSHGEMRWGGEEYCGTVVHGDYFYEGSVRLSLVDPAAPRIVDTISIPGRGPDGVDQDDFRLPAHVLDAVYHVPHPDSAGKGVPEILHLRDFTGDGIATEFALFMYDACGIASGSVLGYDRRSDRVLQYPVEVHDEQGTHIESWVWQIFSTEPVLPGNWEFSWGPGHGSDKILNEDVTFDPARRMFVMRETVQPEPRK